jgi:hypothetical protein
MVVPIKITTQHSAHPELSRRNWHKVMRASMASMGLKWALDLLPEHFDKNKQGELGYAPRTAAWQRRKRQLYLLGKAIEPDTDLVLTGRLKQNVLWSARNLIRAFPSRVTITMYGPPYFTLRARSKRTGRIAQEVLAVSARHKRLLSDAAQQGFNTVYGQLLRSGQLKKTTRTSAA